MTVAPQLSGKAWADPDSRQLADLLAASRAMGWRRALVELEPEAPFFAKRMRNLGLGNWHLLLLRDRDDRALDVGCGFGSLPLGLAEYYRKAIGTEFLSERLSYAALRAHEDTRERCSFVRSSGHNLPFCANSFGLVTMNGVLEWAALYGEGNPRALQIHMLREARRVLTTGGHVAVAIENRFALESLLGLPDTHTGVMWPTVLPRKLASALTRIQTGAPYRTYLYHPAGYRRLFQAAGFESVRVLDLISSYNDYDFVVDSSDAATYRFLFQHGWVRSFFGLAGRVRHSISRYLPGALGGLGYANLVIGGAATATILDADHPLWQSLASVGANPGKHRFACQGEEPGQMAVISHDGEQVTGMVELGVNLEVDDHPVTIPARVHALFGTALRPVARCQLAAVECRVHLPTEHGPRDVRRPAPPEAVPQERPSPRPRVGAVGAGMAMDWTR